RRRGAADRRDHGHVAADQIGGQRRQTLEIPLRPAVFDGDVATLDETRCTETLTECGHNEVRVARRQTAEEADHGHRRLLRARRERQRRRAAEERDEMAAAHHVWMAAAWQEIIWRAAQRSLAVMCPACSRSPDGLLALMESANRGLITRAGSMSQ